MVQCAQSERRADAGVLHGCRDDADLQDRAGRGALRKNRGQRVPVADGLTVYENLLLGAYFRRDQAALTRDLARLYDTFPRLAERRTQAAGTLSGGEQQMLAVGRALMSRPRLLLLDEPSLGLAPLIVANIFQVISKVNEQGSTVLLVEQNVEHTLEIASRGYVLENGRVSLEGAAKDLLENSHLKKAYLGL